MVFLFSGFHHFQRLRAVHNFDDTMKLDIAKVKRDRPWVDAILLWEIHARGFIFTRKNRGNLESQSSVQS